VHCPDVACQRGTLVSTVLNLHALLLYGNLLKEPTIDDSNCYSV
jgi:hypothetical protein